TVTAQPVGTTIRVNLDSVTLNTGVTTTWARGLPSAILSPETSAGSKVTWEEVAGSRTNIASITYNASGKPGTGTVSNFNTLESITATLTNINQSGSFKLRPVYDKTGENILGPEVTFTVLDGVLTGIELTNFWYPYNDWIYVTAGRTINEDKTSIIDVAFDPDTAPYDYSDITWTVGTGTTKADTKAKIGLDDFNYVTTVTGLAAGTTTIKAKVNGTDVSDTINVKVFKAPTLTYNTSSQNMTATMDTGVYVSADYDEDNIEDVNGGDVRFFYGNTEIFPNPKKDYTSQSRTFNISNETLKSLISNNKSLFSSNDETIEVRLYPVGTAVSGDDVNYYTEKIACYGKTNLGIHKIKVEGEHIKETTTSDYYLEGAKVSVQATPETGYKFSEWEDDSSTSSTKQVTVGAAGKNTYKAIAVSTSSSSSSSSRSSSSSKAISPATGGATSGGSGYDRVPRTGESNAIFAIVMLMVLCAFGAVWYSYRLYRPNEAQAGASTGTDKGSAAVSETSKVMKDDAESGEGEKKFSDSYDKDTDDDYKWDKD
nr:hypothetical protein [Lachnospiraceae bacterium]